MGTTARRIGIVCLLALLVIAVSSGVLQIEVSADAAEASVLGWVVARTGLLGLVAFEIVCALLAYCVLSGASFFYFFVRRRQCFNPAYRTDLRAIRRSMLWTVLGIAGAALLAAPFQAAVLTGESRAYWTVETYGWGYLVLSIVLLLAFTETAIYWTHRALHRPLLFRRIHAFHHQFREPTPWAAFAFHPLDAFAQSLPYHIAALLFPLHIGVYTTGVALVMLWSVSIHDRVTLLPFSWLNYAGHHTLHHLHNRYNFGQYFTLWDRIAGTYKCPSTLPDRFAAGRPE